MRVAEAPCRLVAYSQGIPREGKLDDRMSRGAQNFRRSDLIKAVKALEELGLTVRCVEIANGKVILTTDHLRMNGAEAKAEVNEWDCVK